MNTKQSFSVTIRANKMHMEERELSAFMNEVTERFRSGAGQAFGTGLAGKIRLSR